MPLHDIKMDDWKHRALRAEARLEQIAELVGEISGADPADFNAIKRIDRLARGKEQ